MPPSDNELFKFAFYIDAKEKTNFSINQLINIVKFSDGNIKKMLWLCEMKKAGITKYEHTYETKINEIVNLILLKDIKKLPEIRTLLYNLMVTGVECSKILIDITNKLCNINVKNIYNIFDISAKIEHSLCRSRREIISLDHFILSIINFI
jgi:hypothetical protein